MIKPTTLKFGEWLPDQAALSSPGVTEAQNIQPHGTGFRSWGSLATDSTALSAKARGAVAMIDGDANVRMFAGDATKLYRYAGGTYTDKSKSGGYNNDTLDNWNFLKFGTQVIATNYADNIQIGPIDGSSAFADLGGSPPKARFINSVRSFVVLGDILSGSAEHPTRVQWSGQNNETSWGTVPSTQADFQDLVGNGGKIMAITGGDIGVIFQERSIWEMRYEGPPLVWSFNEVSVGIGTPSEGSVVRYGNSVFFLSESGFQRYDIGKGTTPIGDQKVDRWFLDRVNKESYYTISSAIDPANSKVVWSYANGASGNDELLIYDWKSGRWGYAVIDTEIIFDGLSPGYTMDSLDSVGGTTYTLDSLPASLDSDLWKGGAAGLYGFNTSHKSGDFTGTALTARLESEEVGSENTNILTCNNVLPLVEGSTATNTVYVATRANQNSDITYSSGVTVNSATGQHNLRKSARYMRFRVDIAGGFDHALGVRANIAAKGLR